MSEQEKPSDTNMDNRNNNEGHPAPNQTETEPQNEIQVETKNETHAEPQNETQSEPQNETQSEPQNETQAEPQNETQAEPQNETQSEPQNETQSEPQNETQSEPQNEGHSPSHSFAAPPPGVTPHRVLSREELSALMASRRQREKSIREEQRAAHRRQSRAKSAVGALPHRPAEPPMYASATAHPVAYPMGFGASVSSTSGLDFAAPMPPPYTHVMDSANSTHQQQQQLQQQQQQLQQQQQQAAAMYGVWGYPPPAPYVNPNMMTPTAYAPTAFAPTGYDPNALLRLQQQMQQMQQTDAQVMGALHASLQGGGRAGMSVQELFVLAQLIVRAQEEKKQESTLHTPGGLPSGFAKPNATAAHVNTPRHMNTREGIMNMSQMDNEGRVENSFGRV